MTKQFMTTKPLVAITGTSQGIGLAIEQGRPNRYRMLGINRPVGERGYPDRNFMQDISKLIIDNATVFINNAYGPYGYEIKLGEDSNPQLTMFRKVLSAWQSDPSKTIINICSMAAYYGQARILTEPSGVEFQRMYRSNKLALLTASQQATLDSGNVRCRVCAISPGHVQTPRTDSPKHQNKAKLESVEMAKYVWWMIEQPQTLRIPHISMFSVHPDGNIDN